MLKAILFDMDGVIVDSEPLHKKAYYKMFKEVNIEVPETLFESFTGQSTLKICETLCKDFNLTQEPKELVLLKRKYFNQTSLAIFNKSAKDFSYKDNLITAYDFKIVIYEN